MTKTFVISDHHLGHKNILNFKRSDGVTPVRDFSSVDEMHECMITRHNSVVGPEDKVYFLGDAAITKTALPLLDQFNGRKTLIAGNHDIFNTKEYLRYFDNVRGCRVLTSKTKKNIILSHIPISIENRGRFALNVHGHLHTNLMSDPFFFNVCVENIDYIPFDVDNIFKLVDRDDANA